MQFDLGYPACVFMQDEPREAFLKIEGSLVVASFGKILRKYAFLGAVDNIDRIKSLITDFLCQRYDFDSASLLRPILVEHKEGLIVSSILETEEQVRAFALEDENGQINNLPCLAYRLGIPVWCTASEHRELDSFPDAQDFWSDVNLTTVRRFSLDATSRTAVAVPVTYRQDVVAVASFESRKRLAFDPGLANELDNISDAMGRLLRVYTQREARRQLSLKLLERLYATQGHEISGSLADEPNADEEHVYDVALSFAGQNRTVARELAKELLKRGINVYFDEFEQASGLGENLDYALAEVYLDKARFCAVFVSQYYLTRKWCQKELEYALARQKRQKRTYLLPIRLDQTVIEKMPGSIVYFDFYGSGVKELAGLIEEKVLATGPTSDEEAG